MEPSCPWPVRAGLGAVAGLALAASAPVWAGEEESDRATSDTPSASATTASVAAIPAKISGEVDFLIFDEPVVVTTSGRGSGVKTDSGSRGPIASEGAKASQDERWLREREGYRDGGY